MNVRTSRLLILTILTLFALAQELAAFSEPDPREELGKLVVQLFTPDQFDAAPVVRSIVQTPDGLVYGATSAGVAEFDGVRWRLIEHPGVPLSLAVNDAGTVYVGYQSDFGDLVADATGQLMFRSLKDRAPEGTRVRDIRMIATAGSHVVFQSRDNLFRWDGRRDALTVVPANARSPFSCVNVVKGQFVVGVGQSGVGIEGDRLVTLTETGFRALPGSESIPGRIIGIVPLDDERSLIATGRQGLHVYGNKSCERFDTAASHYAQRKNLLQLRRLDDDLFAIGTTLGGVAFFDGQGNILRVIDRDSDLPTNQVHDIVDDRVQQGCWLATSHGISRVNLSSPVQLFDADRGPPDMGQSMMRFKSRMYCGTMAGLFVLEPADEPGQITRFRRLGDWQGSRRALLAVGDRLLAGGSGFNGLDEVHSVDDVRQRPINGSLVGLVQSRRNDVVYASTLTKGARLLQQIGDEWTDRGRIAGTSNEVCHVIEVPGQRLWLSVRAGNGQYRVERVDWKESDTESGQKPKTDAAELPLLHASLVDVAIYDQKKGLPGERRLRTFLWQGDLFASAPTRLFRYDANLDEFVVDATMFPDGTDEESRSGSRIGGVLTTLDTQQQQLWFSNQAYELARISPDDKTPRPAWAIESLAGTHLNKLYSDNGLIWAKTSNGSVLRYDPSLEPEPSPLSAPLLREIRSGDADRLAAAAEPQLPFSTGTMRVTYALARYVSPDRHRYRYRLVGLSDDWSEWSDQTYHEFAALREGSYRFEVAARDELMRESPTAAFEFQVLPPWYRTWWAYTLVAMLIGSLTGGLILWRGIASRRSISRLEGEVKQRQHSQILLYEGRTRLQLLLQIANWAASTDDLDDLLARIAQRVVEIVPAAELGAIYIYDPAADELVPKACVGFDRASYEKIRLRPGESIAGKVFQSEQTFRARSLKETASYRGQLREQNEDHFQRARSQRDVISNVATPLKTSDGETIGVLTFGSTHAQFSQDDQSLLEGLAAQVTVSIQKFDALEQAKCRADELEYRNEELERFTYTVSHDLKSPLVTIKGFLGLLKKEVLAGRLDTFDDRVARMSGAADQMAQLLDELLELSRIDRNTNPGEPVTLEPLVRDVVNQLENRINERGVEVVVASDLPTVNADRVRLREVFQNLIENAVRFMGEQREPRIEVGWRKVQPPKNENSSAPSPLNQPLFYVRDNGIGIPQVDHEKVFGLFEQLNPSPELGGTGIGLAIVRRIIEVHGGQIRVESKGFGEGTAFCFTLGEESHT